MPRNGLSLVVFLIASSMAPRVVAEDYGLGPVLPDADVTVREISTALYAAKPGQRLDYSGKDLTYLDLSGLDFKGALLAHTDLYGTDFTDSVLKGADLTSARLDRAVLIRTDLSGANLSSATILRPTVYSDLSGDVRDAPHFAGANLNGARFQAELSGADFRGAEMTDVDFSPLEARPGQGTLVTLPKNVCKSCDFSGATLKRANFTDAVLHFARFTGASLSGADFKGADLASADFSGATLAGVNFAGADLDGVNFIGAQGLGEAKGLDQARNLDKARR
jgi:uncharacterized protein YjbI with pentapeptide repeats